MANLVKLIVTQQEKGLDLINGDGDFLSTEKVIEKAQKEYVNGLKAGEVPFDTSFEDFKKLTLSAYTSVEDITDFIKSILSGELTNEEEDEEE